MDRVAHVELPAGTVVIADLHLDVQDEPSLEPFLEWLAGLEGVPRLIILGDLFEFWIGPAQAAVGAAPRVLCELARLVERGTPVDVIPGNRDFLLEASFEGVTGCRVASEALVGETAQGERVLFLHGDELCTRDVGHQRLRRVLRSGWFRWLAVHAPRPLATAVARRLRKTSRVRTGSKDPVTMEFVPEACRAFARAHGADVVVCGHAHRHRDATLEGGPRWLVLDDFGGLLDALEVGGDARLELASSGCRRPG